MISNDAKFAVVETEHEDYVDLNLWLDGYEFPTSDVVVQATYSSEMESDALSITIQKYDICRKLLHYCRQDFPQYISSIEVNPQFAWLKLPHDICFDFGDEYRSDSSIRLKIEMDVDSDSFNILSYCTKMRSALFGDVFHVNFSMDALALYVFADVIFNKGVPLSKNLLIFEEAIRDAHNSVLEQLKEKNVEGRVIVLFDFPESVRVPCEQYLLYFAQFLKDTGVEATADLKHEAGEVLFTVTPADADTALEKIRQALHLYLNVPSAASTTSVADMNQPLEVQRYMVVVEHLKGQLMFANMAAQAQQAIIQAKDETIYAKEQAIESLQTRLVQQPPQTITPAVFVESVKEIVGEEKKEDCEEFLGGALEITKYKGDGFNVNFAKMFRTVKDYFNKKSD